MKKLSLLFLFFLLFSLAVPWHALAEVSLGTATVIQISETGIQDGDIITAQEGGGYIRSNTSYDPFLFGVVTLNPSLYLYDKATKTGTPVMSFGKAYVRVSTQNGTIKKGDQITSSPNPGVGIKAVDNGFVIGTAQEEYAVQDRNQIGKILVAVDPRFAQINNNLATTLFSLSRLSFSATLLTPLSVMRYLIAGLLVVLSFYFGLRFFGFASTSGIEAIGRNPLAKKGILITVVINSVLTLVIMLIGLGIAYLILAF